MTSEKLREAENALYQIETASQALPAELKEVLKPNKLSGSFTPLEWYNLLNHLIDFQQLYDNSKQVFKKNVSRDRTFTLGCALVIAVATVYFIFEVMQELGIHILFYAGALALAFIIPVVYGQSPNIRKEKLLIKRFDALISPPSVPNFVQELLLPMLIILNEEMKAGHQLQLFINLSAVQFEPGQDTLKKNYVTRYNYYWKGTQYSDYQWFSFSGKLYDGTSIRFSFNHHSRERYFVKYKRKRNKTKYKYSNKYIYDCRLVMPKQQYQYTAEQPKSKQSKKASKPSSQFPIAYNATETEHVFRLKYAQKNKTGRPHMNQLPITLEKILNPIKEVYKSITPVGA